MRSFRLLSQEELAVVTSVEEGADTAGSGGVSAGSGELFALDLLSKPFSC